MTLSHGQVRHSKMNLKLCQFLIIVGKGGVVDLELGDLEGHLAHAAHGDPVAARREQQELLLQALAVVLQHLANIYADLSSETKW